MPATVTSVRLLTAQLFTEIDDYPQAVIGLFVTMEFFGETDEFFTPNIPFQAGTGIDRVGRGPFRDYGMPISMSFYKQRITIGQR